MHLIMLWGKEGVLMKACPPRCEDELQQRAQALAGKTLKEVAHQHQACVPASLLNAKGWIGQLLEKALGAYALNLDQPDFPHLGIELKTLPITPQGQPCESTYICATSIPHLDKGWEHSRVWRKMKRMLWIPIESHRQIPLAQRRIGSPILWSPPAALIAILRQDWEELSELITLGRFDELSAHKGKYLQIRPKAANAKTFIRVLNQYGQMISIVPKGFYVRALLTQQIIEQHYVTGHIVDTV